MSHLVNWGFSICGNHLKVNGSTDNIQKPDILMVKSPIFWNSRPHKISCPTAKWLKLAEIKWWLLPFSSSSWCPRYMYPPVAAASVAICKSGPPSSFTELACSGSGFLVNLGPTSVPPPCCCLSDNLRERATGHTVFAGYMAAALAAAGPVVFTECDDGARARTTPRVLAVLTVHHHLSRVEAALVSLWVAGESCWHLVTLGCWDGFDRSGVFLVQWQWTLNNFFNR